MQELNSSLDSIELQIYHKPNLQIQSILTYLRANNVKFCTDPKKKQDDYYSKNEVTNTTDLGLRRNRFIKRKQSSQFQNTII